MQVVWRAGEVRAEDVRLALESEHDLKDSTVRTLLRRLETKGVVEHSQDGRAFTYRARIQPEQLAARNVGSIVDRFCKGSITSLLLGMADDSMISSDELRRLADRIDDAKNGLEKKNPHKTSSTKRARKKKQK